MRTGGRDPHAAVGGNQPLPVIRLHLHQSVHGIEKLRPAMAVALQLRIRRVIAAQRQHPAREVIDIVHRNIAHDTSFWLKIVR